MAGDWAKFCYDLFDRRQTIAMSAMLGEEVETIVGRCMRVWIWAQRHTTTGKIKGVTRDTIDTIARKPKFAESMEKVGWLLVSDGFVRFSKWNKHNSKGARARGLDQIRKLRTRSGSCPDSVRIATGQKADQSKSKRERRVRGEQQQRAKATAAAEEKAADAPARIAICSLLLAAKTPDGVRLFDRDTAATIARRCGDNREAVLWALSRYAEETRGGRDVRNPAGFIRSLAENETPPNAFVEKVRRKQLAAIASQMPNADTRIDSDDSRLAGEG